MSFVGQKNRYRCDVCDGAIITIDRDDGATPMLLNCKASLRCHGAMHSGWYNNIDGEPTYEWRRPTLAEYGELTPAMREHVNLGGLCIYAIAPEAPW